MSVWRFFACALVAAVLLISCAKSGVKEVVLYTSQDQVFAEPILKKFTQETGIAVKVVYDSEAVKTVGLANRLLAERTHPQCDLFWSNEELRTRQLASKGLFRETNGFASFGYRTRCFVVRQGLANPPVSLMELTNAAWSGKIAMAYPMFGTTATHFLVLRQLWGEVTWFRWCEGLVANKAYMVDGNSVVVRLVGGGNAEVGLTDSDDVAAGIEGKLPVSRADFSERLFIPNTVAVVRQAPHPIEAQRLFEFLQSPATVEALIAAKAIEGAEIDENLSISRRVDWDKLIAELGLATEDMKAIFLR